MAKWIGDPQGRLEIEKVTEELKLPVWKASYKGKFREFWNECWEKIEDSFLKIKKSNEGKEPAITTKETAFNKPFGVSEDTVLEGNKFTQMTGKDYGGILNITGQKEAGKAYWDNNTKKLYICKNNNSDISPNVNNYVPFDSYSLFERLENFLCFYCTYGWGKKISGNMNLIQQSLNNNEFSVKVENQGVYLIIFTARSSSYNKISTDVNILKNGQSIAYTAFNPTYYDGKYEETVTISTVCEISQSDYIKFLRGTVLNEHTQANIVFLRLM